MLRLEHLFDRLGQLMPRDAAIDHHYALATIFEIMDVASRADLKSDLLKDLEQQKLRLNAYRGLTATMKYGVPGPEGSLGKWHWSEVNQSLTELAMDIAGPHAQLSSDEWTYRFLRARANSIEGGTTEILKNIVAERVLGLPKLR